MYISLIMSNGRETSSFDDLQSTITRPLFCISLGEEMPEFIPNS